MVTRNIWLPLPKIEKLGKIEKIKTHLKSLFAAAAEWTTYGHKAHLKSLFLAADEWVTYGYEKTRMRRGYRRHARQVVISMTGSEIIEKIGRGEILGKKKLLERMTNEACVAYDLGGIKISEYFLQHIQAQEGAPTQEGVTAQKIALSQEAQEIATAQKTIFIKIVNYVDNQLKLLENGYYASTGYSADTIIPLICRKCIDLIECYQAGDLNAEDKHAKKENFLDRLSIAKKKAFKALADREVARYEKTGISANEFEESELRQIVGLAEGLANNQLWEKCIGQRISNISSRKLFAAKSSQEISAPANSFTPH